MSDQLLERVSACGLVRDARELLDRHGLSDEGFQAVGDRLRRFASQLTVLPDGDIPGRRSSVARVLGSSTDGSVALVLAPIGSSGAVPLPDHPAWSIACVVRGHVRYVTWEQPSGDATSRRIARELELSAGDFVYFHDSPHERHGQQAIGGDAWEIRLIGGERAASAAVAAPARERAFASAA